MARGTTQNHLGQQRELSHAARVTRAVDKYEEEPRPSDYFHHFRNALPNDYVQAIDLGANNETIDEAMRVAPRFRTAQCGKPKTSFTAASMSSDRINDLECALERMSAKLENIEEKVEQLRQRLEQLDTGRLCAREYDKEDCDREMGNRRRLRDHAERVDYEREHYDRNRRDDFDDNCGHYDYR